MRIELDIPDWLIGEGRQTRGIFVMAGIEPVAIKLPDQPWQVKTGRCTNCGKCCEFKRVTTGSFLNTVTKETDATVQVCEHLIPDGAKRVCQLGLERPFICCTTLRQVDGCSITYEVVKE